MCVIIIYFLYGNLDTLNAWQVKGTQPCCVSPLPCKANRTWCNSDHILLCIRGLQFSQISKMKLTFQDGIHSQSRACFLVVSKVIGLKSTSATPAVKRMRCEEEASGSITGITSTADEEMGSKGW